MTDPLPELLRAAAHAEVQGDFDAVLAQAGRRRTTRFVAVVLAAALVLVGAGIAAVQVGDDGPSAERLVETTFSPEPSTIVTTSSPVLPSRTPSAAPAPARTATSPTQTQAAVSPSASPGANPTGSRAPEVSPAPPRTIYQSYPAAISTIVGQPLSGRVAYSVAVDRAAARTGDKVVMSAIVANGTNRLVIVASCVLSALTSTGPGSVTDSHYTGLLRTFHERAATQELIMGVTSLGGEACRGKQIAPGEGLLLTQPWSAQSFNDSVYDGQVVFEGTASYRFQGAALRAAGRASLARPDPTLLSVTSQPVALTVRGGISGRLTPLQAVERALSSAEFADVVEKGDPDACDAADATVASRRVVFTGGAGQYVVNACSHADTVGYSSSFVRVDGGTGAVSRVSFVYVTA